MLLTRWLKGWGLRGARKSWQESSSGGGTERNRKQEADQRRGWKGLGILGGPGHL